jgi:hypothetical protein
MNVIRKDATITNTGSDEDFPGTFEVVLSTPAEDRDGDELKTEDWEQPLPEHITFDTDHGMSVASTVGSGEPSIDDDGRLVVSGTYSSLGRAQDTRTLVREGHIRTTSVAFMTKKVTKGGQQRTVRELLNGAFVAIPSNREALVLNSKSVGDANADLERATKALTEAVVKNAAVVGRVAVKSVDGSYEQRQQAIGDALDAAYPDPPSNGYCYAWPLATFDDHVVYRVGGDTDLRGQWQADYTVNDDGTITLGEPEQVTMVEVVKPVDGTAPKGFRLAVTPKNFDLADATVDSSSKPATDSAAAASAETAAAAEPDADQDVLALHLRGLLTTVSAYTAD